MNMDQLTAEMQRVQMEYASNPTPENMAKMQSEMMRLQQEMMAATMQDSSFYADAMAEAQQAATIGQQLVQSMDSLLGDDEEGRAMADFVAAHPPASDKAKYLPIGAFLLNTNGEPYETFALMNDAEDWQEAMENDWEMENAQDGREMLASLLQGRHTQMFDADLQKFKGGQPNELDEDSVQAYHDMLEMLSEALPALLPYAQGCDTILAWDLERAGYLARIFAHLGWISQEESFEWLEKIAAEIKKAFTGWEAYAVSIMTGRALHFESADSVVLSACELFDEENAFLPGHPFSDL